MNSGKRSDESSAHLARQARDMVSEQVQRIVGTHFYGETSVSLTWKDGSLVEVREHVTQIRR